MTFSKEELVSLTDKLAKVQSELNARILERADESKGILLAVLSGSSALFLGDVGTAKTYHITTASTLLGLSNFDILMSETTKPDQIFGPVDIPALAQGKQQTKYTGYAPDSEVLFFDEIFKANATVLNPLLWLINEHKFRDGDNGIITCPIRAVFAASNETPTDPILKAVYDRLILRYHVHYVKSVSNLNQMIEMSLTTSEEVKPILSRKEVDKLRAYVKTIPIPQVVRDLAIKVRSQIEMAMGYKLSDRRFLKAFRIMQAHAVLRGATAVADIDVEVLAHIGWNELSQVSKVQSIVFANTSGDTVEVSSYLERAIEINNTLHKKGNP